MLASNENDSQRSAKVERRVISMRSNFISIWGGFWSKRVSKRFFPQATRQVTSHLYAIKDRDVNLFLYADDSHVICFDAGYIDNHYLGAEFQKIGVDPASITHLFLTHTDMDHAGAIDKDSRSTWFAHAQVFMGQDEVPMIDGSKPRKFIFKSPVEIARPFDLLDDGDMVQIGPIHVETIATPGHTIGHVSYLINGHILIGGDVIILLDGQAEPFYQTWNMDHVQVKHSVKKLARLDGISILCTAHTQCTTDFAAAMQQWR